MESFSCLNTGCPNLNWHSKFVNISILTLYDFGPIQAVKTHKMTKSKKNSNRWKIKIVDFWLENPVECSLLVPHVTFPSKLMQARGPFSAKKVEKGNLLVSLVISVANSTKLKFIKIEFCKCKIGSKLKFEQFCSFEFNQILDFGTTKLDKIVFLDFDYSKNLKFT